ncbi:hypothetical protein Salat_1109000 [Sesamum alatum]|uniref:Uncharacterized protein n=1 Tax=Sesamum alatum TaxID=300844 RepID=A0AAE1YNT8_9LAMI|nr:hypothetical protein Salat_1109000 [Sesamum alatum]
MEAAAVSHVKAAPPPPIFRTKTLFSCPSTVSFPVQNHQTLLQKQRLVLKCAKEGSVSQVEKQLMEEEELIGIMKLNDKCKGLSGVVELLECLEREAIMGEDEGREPTDYNRRAQIFDKSSRVFQALKHTTSAH